MVKTRVWVLTALFTADNKESRVEVVGVYNHLDKAVETMWFHHENIKEAWVKDGIKEDDMLNIRTKWVCVLKINNRYKQVELGIYGEDIDND